MAEINDLLSNISNIKTDIKSAIKNKGQNVTNFASYPNAISNIVSGGEGVKQYDSLENMYADISNAHNGDLATVYASSQAGITETTEFQVATFPQTVVLDEALSDYVQLGFQAVDESIMFDCMGQLDNEYFMMDCYTDDENIRIEYESQDGLTYTRTRFMKNEEEISGNEMDFGTLIKFGNRWEESEFNSVISKFIISGSTVFDGIFQYNGTNFNLLSNTGLNINPEALWNGKFYGANGIQNGTLSQITNLNLQQLKDRVNLYSNISNLALDESINNASFLFQYKYNITNVPNINTSNVTDMRSMFEYCNNLATVPNFDTSNVTTMESLFYGCSNLTNVPNFNTSNVTSMYGTFSGCNNLTSIPNFNTSKVTLMTQMFYGCNNLVAIPNLDFSSVNKLWESFYYCANLTSIPESLEMANNITEVFSAFGNCYSITSIPNINLSLVSNIEKLFIYCSNLVNIPNINFSNVKKASQAFAGCRNLTNLSNVDFSNVVNSESMFSTCTNLVDMSALSFDSLVNATYMFSGCTNLTNLPNIDLKSVENTSGIFFGCTNLVNIPILNMNNVTNATNMFYNCNSLSPSTYSNIANMLPNANQFDPYHRLLSYMGLNVQNFSSSDNSVLKNKGYLEYQPNYYTIQYT